MVRKAALDFMETKVEEGNRERMVTLDRMVDLDLKVHLVILVYQEYLELLGTKVSWELLEIEV